jgi:hypothetical protein
LGLPIVRDEEAADHWQIKGYDRLLTAFAQVVRE